MARIDEYLEEILKRDGSDLHFMAGDPPRIRQYGKLSSLRSERLGADFVREAIYEIMPRKALDRLETRDGTDFAYTLGTLARFRVNVLRQLNGLVAGTSRMPWPKFLAANVVGAALWVGVWTTLAYRLGRSTEIVPLIWHHLNLVAAVGILLLIGVLVVLRFRAGRRSRRPQ